MFTARRCASAVYAVVMCLSICVCVCLSQAVCVEMTTQIELVFGIGFPLTYPQLCCKEIRVPSKNKGTSLWDFAPNSGL